MCILLELEYTTLDDYRIIFWTGNLEDTTMLFYQNKTPFEPFQFHRYYNISCLWKKIKAYIIFIKILNQKKIVP